MVICLWHMDKGYKEVKRSTSMEDGKNAKTGINKSKETVTKRCRVKWREAGRDSV